MSFKTIELREKRAGLVNEARALLDREQNAEVTAQYDKIMGVVNELRGQIDRMEGQEKLELELASETRSAKTMEKTEKESDEVRATKNFEHYIVNNEVRDLAFGSTNGVFAPNTFVNRVIMGVDSMVSMRKNATILKVTSGDTLGMPYLTDMADTAWTTEVEDIAVDSTMAFGKRELKPNQLAKMIKVSMKLLRNSAVPVEQLIAQRFAAKFAAAEEVGFLTGSGSGQPLGLFTASANGIPTTQDIVCGTTTAISIDGLYDVFYGLAAQYRPNAQFIFGTAAIKQISKLKDAEDRFVWNPALSVGAPDLVLGKKYIESAYAPSTLTAGLYSMAFGDLSTYFIAENMTFEIQRLNELYAKTSQIGIIARAEVDGMPTLAAAIVRGKMAAV